MAAAAPAAGAKPAPQPNVKVTVTHQAPTAAAAHAGIQQALGKVTPSAQAQTQARAAQARTKTTAPQTAAKQLTLQMPGGGKPAAQQQTAAKPQQPSVYNPLAPPLNSQQLQQIGRAQATQQVNQSLAPLRQQAAQLKNIQQTVSQRYQGYTKQGAATIAGIIAQQQQQAAAAQNAMAQSAVAGGQMLAGAGQAAAQSAGGYVGPAQQAAMANQGQLGAANAQAYANFVPSQNQTAANLLDTLRASAVMQGRAGLQNIQSIYGKQLTTNAQNQQNLINTIGSKATSIAQQLAQQQFQNEVTKSLTKGKLATAYADINIAKGKLALGQYAAYTNRMNSISKTSYDQAQVQLKSRGLDQSQAGLNLKTWVAQQNAQNQRDRTRIAWLNNQLSSKSLSERTRHDYQLEKEARVRDANSSSKSVSSGTSLAGIAAIQQAQQRYHQMTTMPASVTDASGNKTTRTLNGDEAHAGVLNMKGMKGVEAEAGYQMGRFGYINAQTARQLQNQGVFVPASWTQQPAGPQNTPGFNLGANPFTNLAR